jgi:hypothetical protein
VNFDVAMGRMLAVGNRAKQDRQRVVREYPNGTTETLTVTLDRGLVSMQYEFVSQSRQLAIRVARRDHVEIESRRNEPRANAVTAVFRQQPGSDVVLTLLTDGQAPVDYRSPSLWHLLLTHPELCQTHLYDALRLLRPNWQIDNEVAEIRAMLFHCDPARLTTSRREVELLVEQMAHDDFRVRQRSARELQARGRSVLGFLQELDATHLDAEQRLRTDHIRDAIIGDAADTPAGVVAWLVNDKSAWLALLNDETPGCRARAGSHLARLCDREIEFDPDASRETRELQVASLRSALLR